MIDPARLAQMSGLTLADIDHWQKSIAAGSGFTRVSIPQRRRRPREILRPSNGLDRVLKQLRLGLDSVSNYKPPNEVHGFVKGRGTLTNAAMHLNKDVVLSVDLRDFFATVDRTRVVQALDTFGFDSDAATAVAGVTLVAGSLAQGFSTSPLLSNMAFFNTDIEIAKLASNAGIAYTRYVDDLVFSGSQDDINDQLLETITALLKSLGWAVNSKKTRFMRRGRPQYVTGLYVGDAAGPHVPRSMKRLLRREVYYASKFGLDDARAKSPTPMDDRRLSGWVHYAAHADPVFGANLLATWNQVAPARSSNLPPDWDQVLDDIDFPPDL